MPKVNIGLDITASPVSALYGSAATYVVGGFIPGLITDFEAEYYRTKTGIKSFSDTLTHTRAGKATMVDADGVLKWAPHNLLTYSEDLTNGWTTVNATIGDSETISFTAFSGAVTSAFCSTSVGAGYTIAVELWSETDAGKQVDIGFNTNNISNTFSSPITLTATPTLYTFSKTNNTATLNGLRIRNSDSLAKTIKARKARLYRSDLGGMVDNPDTGNSYVPTTSSARYFPRRGHHVWNGSAWVNEGLLVESEARTNSIRNNTNVGATVGVVGSGGALPTNWVIFGLAAPGDAEVVAVGTEDGRNYIDLRINGTPTSGITINFESTTDIVATLAEDWTLSVGVKGVGGSDTNITSYALGFAERNAVGGFLASGMQVISLDEIFVRPSFTYTTTNASVERIQPRLFIDWTSGAIDRTLRISLPQAEKGPTPSSPILTSGSTATRAADVLTVPAANLPWPTPEIIGPELVTNGTFDTDTDWTKGTGWTISGGVASSSDGSAAALTQALSTTSGKLYSVTFTISNGSGSWFLGVRLGDASNQYTFTTEGTKTVYLIDKGDHILRFADAASGSFALDNISVREINPLAVSIQMDGLETFADEGSATQETLFDWRVDANNRITLNLDTDSTKVGTLTLTMVNGSGTDETISTTAELTPGVNDPFNVAIVCTSNEIGIALDGTAETRVSHSIGLPDLSAEDATLGGNGTRAQLRAWAIDLTNAGQESATS